MLVEVSGRVVFAHDGGVPPDPGRPVVLLVHGAGQDHSVFRRLTRLLAHRGRAAVAVDLPGHGRSDGPALSSVEALAGWVLDVLAALGAEHAAIVGHSMGGLVAVDVAARAADRVECLVLSGVASPMHVHPDLQEAADRADPRAVDLIAGWTHGGKARFGGHPDPGVWARGATTRLLERELASLAADLRACATSRVGDRAAEVACPVTVLVAGDDRMTPPGSGVELAGRFPRGRVVRVPDAGHNLPGDAPAEMATVVLAALAEGET